ncbi:MAG: hypothetical protein PHO15_01415 [Eubacteriales bacterium]|nr:hypothetical protein [Eubacteriales bacterium]
MKKVIVIAIIAVAAALVFWFFYPLRSYAVMSVYSAQHSADSVMEKNGFSVDMPAGEGWYPFVMTYNADGFKGWSGIDADMSIMYSFGAFDFVTRTSSIYDGASDKYSSFYGAYAVQESGGVFGFSDDGDIEVDDVALAVRYDYTQLVIADFGCGDTAFAVDEYSIARGLEYAGSGGWTRVDATITANGAAHNYAGYKTPYLQYGRPMQTVESDFEILTLYGRVYAKYFDEYDCTVMIYVIAPSAMAVQDCDDAILKKTQIIENQAIA